MITDAYASSLKKHWHRHQSLMIRRHVLGCGRYQSRLVRDLKGTLEAKGVYACVGASGRANGSGLLFWSTSIRPTTSRQLADKEDLRRLGMTAHKGGDGVCEDRVLW